MSSLLGENWITTVLMVGIQGESPCCSKLTLLCVGKRFPDFPSQMKQWTLNHTRKWLDRIISQVNCKPLFWQRIAMKNVGQPLQRPDLNPLQMLQRLEASCGETNKFHSKMVSLEQTWIQTNTRMLICRRLSKLLWTLLLHKKDV